jgi:cell division protein FtsQ
VDRRSDRAQALSDRLQITVTEREAFALWQQQGKVQVIAADGTVLSAKVEPRLATLPFVVGTAPPPRRAISSRARQAIRDPRSGARLDPGGDRRWNLRLKNGIDVRLPRTTSSAR